MKKVTKEDIYSTLVQAHKFTPNQIADMNIFQQMAAMKVDGVSSTEMRFNSMSEYLAWKQEQGK